MRLNFYMTSDSRDTIKHNYPDIYKNSEIIDVRTLLEKENLYFFKTTKIWNQYILFLRIHKLFQRHIKNRKDIIYIVQKIENKNISEIKKYLNEKYPILLYSLCLIDFNDKVNRNLYTEFDVLL